MTPRSLPKEGSWNGQACVIVGGGPSLRAFDFSSINATVSSSHERPYRTIAINRAFQDAPTADVFFTEDVRVVSRFGPTEAFRNFRGIKLLHLLDEGYVPEITPYLDQLTLIRKKREDKFWSRSWEEGLAVSSNSGIGALNVADILGASRIYLLGFDCRRTEDAANYHLAYPSSWNVGTQQLADYASDFSHWAALWLRKSGREVINVVNPNFLSALTCWPTMEYSAFYACDDLLHPELSRGV